MEFKRPNLIKNLRYKLRQSSKEKIVSARYIGEATGDANNFAAFYEEDSVILIGKGDMHLSEEGVIFPISSRHWLKINKNDGQSLTACGIDILLENVEVKL